MSFQAEVITVGSTPAKLNRAHELHVVVVLHDHHDIFSLSILLDLLAAANRIALRSAFHCEIVTEAGLTQALRGTSAAAQRLVLIADANAPTVYRQETRDSLIKVWSSGGTVGAWGGGVIALAEAGLLAGRRFALSLDHRSQLTANLPKLAPVDRSFCQDDRVLTSVGRFALSDMVLHLIKEICGKQVMLAVMDHCLISCTHEETNLGRVRPVNSHAKIDPRIANIDTWILNNIAQPFKVQDLAEMFSLSTRHLERLFLRNLSRTPAAHIEHMRLSRALRLFQETSLSMAEIAQATGHCSRQSFKWRFKRKFGTSLI